MACSQARARASRRDQGGGGGYAGLVRLSGEHGDTLFEIVAFVCPNQLDPVFAPFEFEFDLENRTGRVRAGDVFEIDVDTLRNIDPPTPYRVVVQIPNRFEYTRP